jgi:hypothetical protein
LGRPDASDEIKLYRWTVSRGAIAEIMTAGKYANLCYDRGYLYVSFDRGENRVIREGPIGQETETVFKRGTGTPSKGVFNPYNCRYRDLPAATQADHGVVTVLRDDHGFIEAERPWERYPQRKYFLVRPTGERIWLKSFHGGAGAPSFSQFRQAYIFQYGGSDLSERADKHLWQIGLDGSVTEYELPKGAWSGGSTKAMPVRQGLLLISPNSVKGAQGVYVLRSDALERIVGGYVNALAVSPNGCDVAIYINPRDANGPQTGLLNICTGHN